VKINDIVTEQQLDEFGFNDIQKGAKKITKGAQKFTKNVNKTGDAVAGAASAIGGAGKALGNQLVARPVAGAYNAVKSGAKGLGKAAATVAGDVAGGAGAVAGGATTGVARAASKGFNTGANAVGGEPADKLGKVFKQDPVAQPTATASNTSASGAGVDVASIENQIDQHKTAISGLQAQLAQARGAQAQTQAQATQATTPQSTDSLGTKIGNAVGNVAKGAADAVNRAAFAGIGNVADQSYRSPNRPTQAKQLVAPPVTTKTPPVDNRFPNDPNAPAQAQPAQAQPAPAQPAQAQPAVAQPAPAQAQPASSQPAQPARPAQAQQRAQQQSQATTMPQMPSKNMGPVDTAYTRLPNNATSATGGQTTTTPTGQVHRANPNNKNIAQLPAVSAPQRLPYTKQATTATPNYGQRPTGYAKPTYNVPTSPMPQVTTLPYTNAKNTSTNVNYKPPATAGTNSKPAMAESSKDFSALLLNKTK